MNSILEKLFLLYHNSYPEKSRIMDIDLTNDFIDDLNKSKEYLNSIIYDIKKREEIVITNNINILEGKIHQLENYIQTNKIDYYDISWVTFMAISYNEVLNTINEFILSGEMIQNIQLITFMDILLDQDFLNKKIIELYNLFLSGNYKMLKEIDTIEDMNSEIRNLTNSELYLINDSVKRRISTGKILYDCKTLIKTLRRYLNDFLSFLDSYTNFQDVFIKSTIRELEKNKQILTVSNIVNNEGIFNNKNAIITSQTITELFILTYFIQLIVNEYVNHSIESQFNMFNDKIIELLPEA